MQTVLTHQRASVIRRFGVQAGAVLLAALVALTLAVLAAGLITSARPGAQTAPTGISRPYGATHVPVHGQLQGGDDGYVVYSDNAAVEP